MNTTEVSNKLVNLTTSELARSILEFKGKRFSLAGYKPLEMIYDTDASMTTLKCCRQIGKSVSIAAILTAKSIARPYFNSVYIAPLAIQSSRFSKLYLGPFADSPLVNKYFKDTRNASNVFLKEFNNGSKIFLSYAQTEQDSDRVRGLALDAMSFDEVQDCAIEALPVLYETLAASPYAFKRHYGTAKSTLNTLEVLFNRGSGCEWAIKCTHCNRWNIPDNLETCLAMCKGPDGPICSHCSGRIDVTTGRWVAARPNQKDHLSFHIPRHVLEARIAPKMWRELHNAIKTYTPTKLANEVFGLAAGVAGRILSQREAMLCCNPAKTEFDAGWPQDSRAITSVVLGVDWSITAGVNSYTVITILGYDFMGKCYVLHSERLNGIDILDQVRRVEQLAIMWNVSMVGSDRGVGQLQYELLKNSLGPHRVIPIQYCAAKKMLRYDTAGAYLAADRSQIMDLVFLKMKLGRDKFETPSWERMTEFWPDALSIFEEESLSGRRLYRKDDGACDDWFHSVVFGHTAWMVVTGQFELLDQMTYSPEEENGWPASTGIEGYNHM